MDEEKEKEESKIVSCLSSISNAFEISKALRTGNETQHEISRSRFILNKLSISRDVIDVSPSLFCVSAILIFKCSEFYLYAPVGRFKISQREEFSFLSFLKGETL